MFGLDWYIDTFQNTKRMLTNQVFTDKRVNKVANDFIDAQTTYAKMLVNNTLEMMKYTADKTTECWTAAVTKNEKTK